ncbi:UNVERIFIED_CONTAM: hypothetical protein Slati_4199500 [Sesamum latifolium]|uniref:DUF4218 domain-containing protein n=1 Tax=Sesamum latifolium TaxID=2727402 RepID=A0AAW2TDB6_9LAMI
MPKAVYTLIRELRRRICEWITRLKFLDGYAFDLARCVDMKELRLHGMKSHDFHVFMQKLILIAFCEMLPESVWSALTDVSLLFQIICSTTLDVVKVQELEDKVATILYNLEKIFSPSFFDSMEHLIVHLPYEAHVGGPVQYRWMYPFERFLKGLKMKVKNKAHVEASIVEVYLVEEISIFTSQYFEPQFLCKRNRLSRNDDLAMNNDTHIQQSIFNFPGRGSGASKKRWLSGSECHIIETYILTNCEVVTSYYKFEDPIIEELVATQLKYWFKRRVKDEINYMGNELLKLHYWGPTAEVTTFLCYFVNGYNFHTEHHNVGKSTFNCGVCVKSKSYTDMDSDFYGILEEVIQLDYPLIPNMQIILFKYRWVDPVRGMKVHPRYHLVDVNFKKVYQKNEPFILAQQAVQVYYTEYPSMKMGEVDWMAVCKIKARRVVNDSRWTEVAFQEDESIPTPQVLTDDHNYALHEPNSIQLVVDFNQQR